MKKNDLGILLLILLLGFNTSWAQDNVTMQILFNALKDNPVTKADSLVLEQVSTNKKAVNSKFYPEVNLFGTYDYFSEATGMLPVTPNDLFKMIPDQTIPQPFSNNIFRVGASLSMPIFVKSLYSTTNKMDYLYASAEANYRINLLRNQAILVSANANLEYVDALIKALESKKQSLIKTKEVLTVKVNNGRAPSSSLLLLNSGLNEIDATINEVKLKKEVLISSIQERTNIRVSNSIEMSKISVLDKTNMAALDPLKEKLKADEQNTKSQKDMLWPSLYLRGNYNHGFANAYNNDLAVNTDYYTVGLALKVPIFAKSKYTSVHQSKLNHEVAQNEYDRLELSLKVEAQQLANNLILLEQSIKIYEENIIAKQDLLAIAKVSYDLERMTIEEYLKYEDHLLLEKSKLYKTKAEKWQTLMKLAVIYGNNIENLVQ